MSVKVSVVIPVYNPGRYIEPCVESLLHQTLPPDEYEVIFVDDGSSDETPAYLDELADTHAHIRTIHIPNSGWPGRPRNIGVDAAAGEYVQFVDQDDHLAPDALRRLYDMGARNGSDIVIGKVASNFRGIPHGIFRADRDKCTIHDFPLIDSLTPHKMFRTAFLREHDIRYAEGKRRLEDQLYMVQSYFPARVVSILGSYTCYFYSKRDDGGNAGATKIVPSGYYGNLREVLDVVVANTEPGAFRDRLIRRFYRIEMLSRVSEPALPRYDDEYRTNLIDAIEKLAADFVTDGVHDGLAAIQRLRSTLLRQDRRAELIELARRCYDVTGQTRLDDLSWRDGRIVCSVTTQLVHNPDKRPLLLLRQGDRYFVHPSFYDGLLPSPERFEVTDEFGSFRTEMALRDRESAVEWPCPAEFIPEIKELGPAEGLDGIACQVVMRGTVRLDPGRTKTRGPLAKGRWDAFARVNGIGFSKRVRFGSTRGAQVEGQSLPALLGDPATLVVPFFVDTADNLTLDVDRRAHGLGDVIAGPDIRAVSTGGRWIDLLLPVATRPGTAASDAALVIRTGSPTDAPIVQPARLVAVGDRIHLRARGRLTDRNNADRDDGETLAGSPSLRAGTWELAARLDGPDGAEVNLGKVRVRANGRLTVTDVRPIDRGTARQVRAVRTTHRRQDMKRVIRRMVRPIAQRLPAGPRKALRARFRSWGL
ncbi:MAG TPA: glycosyltransferase family 2 protein [Micromonosporaceae bacterium]